MDVVEITSKAQAESFLQFGATINENNPSYIRPLDSEVEGIFSPQKNKHFQGGKAIRWLLVENNEIIGRIAAFIDKKYKSYKTEFPCGGVGYFDCINDQTAANLLFDTAKNWLQSQGIEAMDGPINFGERDYNWGLMVKGFEVEPYYGMSFNPPYYESLFENYGFQNYYNQYYFYMNVDDVIPQKFQERHDRIAAKKGYSARMLDIKHLEKFAEDFATIYNVAWSQHGENKKVDKTEILNTFQQLKIIIDPTLIWFAYYKEEPIAMWINIPDLNQYFKHFDGKMNFLNKLKLLYLKWTKQCKRFTGIAFGVVPKFQLLGIDSYLIVEGSNYIQKVRKYQDYEMGWTSEWNPKMLNMYSHLGSKKSRKMITYRYIFDNKYPFEPHPIMEYKR